MSDGDKPRIGSPVIHVTTSDHSSDEEVKSKQGEATGRHGIRDVQSNPEMDQIVRRPKGSLSQSGQENCRITLVDGRRSQLSEREDQITALFEDDEASSGVSDMKTEVLKSSGIKVLEGMLTRVSVKEKPCANKLSEYCYINSFIPWGS